jgi:hypothetical protein
MSDSQFILSLLLPGESHHWKGSGKALNVQFANGYGLSVIWTGYGSNAGLMEVGVTCNGSLCYDTPITDDVIGWVDRAEIRDLVSRVRALVA